MNKSPAMLEHLKRKLNEIRPSLAAITALHGDQAKQVWQVFFTPAKKGEAPYYTIHASGQFSGNTLNALGLGEKTDFLLGRFEGDIVINVRKDRLEEAVKQAKTYANEEDILAKILRDTKVDRNAIVLTALQQRFEKDPNVKSTNGKPVSVVGVTFKTADSRVGADAYEILTSSDFSTCLGNGRWLNNPQLSLKLEPGRLRKSDEIVKGVFADRIHSRSADYIHLHNGGDRFLVKASTLEKALGVQDKVEHIAM